MTDASATAPDYPMVALLALQGVDTEIHQLLHRRGNLPEAQEFEAASAEQRALQAERATVSAERDLVAERQAELEERIAKQSTRLHELERQMKAAQNVAPRDLEAMDHELHQVAEFRSTLEDDELLLLEELEPLDAALAEFDEREAALDAHIAEIRARGSEAVAAIDAALIERRAERDRLANDVPGALLGQYEAIRKQHGAVGAARLRGDRCDGCSLSLSAVERDRVLAMGLDEVSTCEHCGRILIRDRQLS